MTGLLIKAGIVLLVINEIRGLILAAPLLYGMYHAGSTGLAMWVSFCSLAGIVISVVGPLVVFKKFRPPFERG